MAKRLISLLILTALLLLGTPTVFADEVVLPCPGCPVKTGSVQC